ncbi:MAG: hypothetical protein HY094_00310 [Candidatus Melainabacteria bacterium]|nr:hypothetical protein [Candidatus Melainabacteria bacterium]
MILSISILDYIPFLRRNNASYVSNTAFTGRPQSASIIDSDQYVGAGNSPPPQRQQIQPQEPTQEPPKKSFWGRVWGAVRGVAVTLTATIVTGALIASGVGIIGVAVAIGAGILAGTAVGAATNVATAIANGGTREAWGEALQNTVQDFKSSCIGAVSTACGFGVARLVTGTGQVAASASLGTRLFAGSAAGGTGATVSTVAGTVDQSIQLRRQFEEEHGQINSPEKERQYQEFLRQNNATWGQTIKSSFVNIFTGFVSGGLGARFQAARAANQSAISQGLNVSRGQVLRSSMTAEASLLTGTGFVSSYATHGHLSLEEAIQHVGGSYGGGYLGHISSRYTERNQQTRVRQGSTTVPPPSSTQLQPPPLSVVRPSESRVRMSPGASTTEAPRTRRAERSTGSNGVFRSRYNETSATNKLNRQLRSYSASDIQKIIESLHPQQQRMALSMLDRMSQFGNTNSINRIFERLKAIEAKYPRGYSIVSDRRAFTADMIYYLKRKGSYNGEIPQTRHLPSFEHIDPAILRKDGNRGIILMVDDSLLSTLRSNPRVVAKIRELRSQGLDVRFVYAEGLIGGINPFNQSGNIRTRLEQLTKRALRISRQRGISETNAITEVLTGRIQRRLKKLGLDSNLDVVRDARGLTRNPSYQSIAEQLSSPAGLPSGRLLELNSTRNRDGIARREHADQVCEILGRSMRIVDARTMSELLIRQQRKILKHAASRGISQDRIFYLIPYGGKSYSIVTMQSKFANNIPQSQIIANTNQIPPGLRNRSMVVVLDDFAASGHSLGGNNRTSGEYQSIRNYGYKGELVIAPLFTTPAAYRLFNGRAASGNRPATPGLVTQDPQLTYIPGRLHRPFRQSAYYRGLPRDQRRLVDEVIGQYRGWGNIESSIIFWYMAPNNNLPLVFFNNRTPAHINRRPFTRPISEQVARYFTFNGCGVKSTLEFNRQERLAAAG